MLCYKQDTVQALDAKGLKIFARKKICGHRSAGSSRAAVGIEQREEHCSSSFHAAGQAGKRSTVQSKRETVCEGMFKNSIHR